MAEYVVKDGTLYELAEHKVDVAALVEEKRRLVGELAAAAPSDAELLDWARATHPFYERVPSELMESRIVQIDVVLAVVEEAVVIDGR